jgi:phage shock protein C
LKEGLYRSRDDAMIGGVCGGLGEHLGIDSLWVRIFFLLLALGNGIGVLLYFLLWISTPLEGQPHGATLQDNVRLGSQEIAEHTLAMSADLRRLVRRPQTRFRLIVGSVLIIWGVFNLLEYLGFPGLWWLDFDLLWPVLLILGGLALLLRRSGGEPA